MLGPKLSLTLRFKLEMAKGSRLKKIHPCRLLIVIIAGQPAMDLLRTKGLGAFRLFQSKCSCRNTLLRARALGSPLRSLANFAAVTV